MRLLGDERLARLVAAGNPRAFAVLYERHHQALYRYSRAIVRNEDDAADVLQTTMERALAALSRGVPDAPMRPWLFRIAHNEAISLLRRRRPTTDLDQAPELEGPGLEARVEQRSRLTTLVADLNELPDRQRSALVMRELSGLSHGDIAAALEISVPAAKQAIFDARTGLQEFAKGRAMECADVERIISERDGRMLRGRPLRAHLRGCDSCRALRDAIGARRSELAALAPPLPAAAATGLLAGILGGGGHGGGASGLLSGLTAKAAAGAVTGKALAGAAVVATVAVGTAQVLPATTERAERDAVRAPTGAGPAARAPAAAGPAAPAPPARAGAVRPAREAAAAASTTPTRGARAHATPRRRVAGATAPVAGRPRDAAPASPGARPDPASPAASRRRFPAQQAAGRRPAASHPATASRPSAPRRPARGKATTPASTRAPSRPTASAPARPSRPAAGAPAASRPTRGTGGPAPEVPGRASTPTADGLAPAGEVPAGPAPAAPVPAAPTVTPRAAPAATPAAPRAG